MQESVIEHETHNIIVEENMDNIRILHDVKGDFQMKTMNQSSPIPWPNSKSLTLIELYKATPSLWDPSNAKYRDKKSRRQALYDISKTLSCSVEEVERKIHGLRTQFLRECRRHCDNSTWFGYASMKFLSNIRNAKFGNSMQNERAFTIQRVKSEPVTGINSQNISIKQQPQPQKIEIYDEETYHNSYDNSIAIRVPYDEEEPKETEYEVLDENCSEYEIRSMHSDTNEQNVSSEVKKPVTTVHTTIIPHNTAKRFCLDESSGTSPLNTHNYSITQNDSSMPTDHLEIFGRYVTGELRNIIDDPYSVQVAKHKINQILFEASTGEFKKKTY